jgi:plasmid stabilization system protein ParE
VKEFRVVFTPEAEEQLVEIYDYVAMKASAETAFRYTTSIVDYCEGMRIFPHRGTQRDDVRPGLRISNYKGNAVTAFAADDAAMTVTILGVFYGGQDYVSDLSA